ncbi:hypothetical protein ACFX2I_038366 [Malus domestica]|uniref:NB-ARC domain-containing protein n=1 Tax=Malus domestica TaxID=3750 RepID=A0A498JLR7_MALDO|nr:hypothetical protein DVH24_008307 [Malus domestica]
MNVPSVKGTRDAKKTLQTSASNTEAGLEQIQGKDVLDCEPPGLKRFLLNDEVSAVVLTGPQGSGKTTLAKFFCEDEEVRNIFKNNIFFVHVSENPNLSLIDDEFLSWVFSPPSVTFDDESLIDHFPDSSASDLGGRSSHVSTASGTMDQFQDSSASTLGYKSYIQDNAKAIVSS